MRAFLTFSALITFSLLNAQVDNAGSGRAIAFDGVDDYIDLGNIYDDLEFPFTISAWVFPEEGFTVQSPIFASQDNSPLYNGFWFCVNANNVFVGYGDGQGENNPAFRREKSAPLPSPRGWWINVAAVVNSRDDMELYVNGINAGGVITGSSSLPMSSAFPNDVAKIGFFYTNSVTHRFKGKIDELKIFNRALSEFEIRETMCKKALGNESGLIGYWPFDETSGTILKDKSSGQFDGELKGNPVREYSGAPIGNESIFVYPDNWVGQSIEMDDLTVHSIGGSPGGIHMYKVNEIPSQTVGLDVASDLSPYYGIFVADNSPGKTFNLENVCDVFGREDNSVASWHAIDLDQPIVDRIEINGARSVNIELDLGSDTIICNQGSFLIRSNFMEAPGRSFLWSTGETESAISVSLSGDYALELTDGCGIGVDTMNVLFYQSPPEFTLGGDSVVCLREPITLTPLANPSGLDYTWQDGSKQSIYSVETYGKFWVTVASACGSTTDTIEFVQPRFDPNSIPNVITPNADASNDVFWIDPALAPNTAIEIFNRWGKKVFQSSPYKNDWAAQGLGPGVYYYTLSAGCIRNLKGIIHVIK